MNFSANTFDKLSEINDFLRTCESLKINTRRTIIKKKQINNTHGRIEKVIEELSLEKHQAQEVL